jgi:hypothetical protein
MLTLILGVPFIKGFVVFSKDKSLGISSRALISRHKDRTILDELHWKFIISDSRNASFRCNAIKATPSKPKHQFMLHPVQP